MLSRPGQLFYRWFSERGLFRVFMRVCVAGVLSAGACVVVGGSAGAGVPTTISLAGSFGGVTSVGTVIGAAQGRSATGLTGQSFLFYSVCTRLGANGTTPVPCGPVSYNFGDGTIRSGKGQVRHGFTVAGTYSVTATLEDGQYAVAQMQAIVSPYYLDVRGVASRAIWSLGSQGILGNCGGGLFCPHPTSEVPATRSTTLLGDTVPGATHVRVSSAVGVFIGQRISISTMSSFVSGVNGTIITVHPGLGPARARGTTVVLRPYLASALVNGVTGESCLVAPSACGLPAS
jgi:hypothetical protein